MSLFLNVPVYTVADRPRENGESIYLVDVVVYTDEKYISMNKVTIKYVWAIMCPDTGYIDDYFDYTEGDKSYPDHELVLLYDGIYEPLTLEMRYIREKDIDRVFPEDTV